MHYAATMGSIVILMVQVHDWPLLHAAREGDRQANVLPVICVVAEVDVVRP